MDYVFEFDAVAEGSAGGDDGIFERDAGDGYCEVRGVGGGGGHADVVYRKAVGSGQWLVVSFFPQGPKLDSERRTIIAAVNRCATQNQDSDQWAVVRELASSFPSYPYRSYFAPLVVDESAEGSGWWGGARASVRTRPMAWVGALMPRSEDSVTDRSTGSAWVR